MPLIGGFESKSCIKEFEDNPWIEGFIGKSLNPIFKGNFLSKYLRVNLSNKELTGKDFFKGLMAKHLIEGLEGKSFNQTFQRSIF